MKITRTAIGNLTQKSLDILKDLKKNWKTRTSLKLSDFLYLYCSSNKVISKMKWTEVKCNLKEDFIIII